MNITFPNPAHVTSVWVPELMPTHANVVSMVMALLFCSLLLSAVAVMFYVFCMEKVFSRGRAIGMFVGLSVVLLGCGFVTNQLTGTNAVQGELAALTKHGAIEGAKRAAIPAAMWRERAKEVSPQGHPVQKGWNNQDMHHASLVVEQAKGLKPVTHYSRMVIATEPMTDGQIAVTGSSYRDGAKTERCVVWLSNVSYNNVGQPLSAKISSLRCVPAP